MAFQRDPMSTTGLQRSTNVIGVFQHNKGAPLTGMSLPSGAGGMGVQPPGRPQAPAMRAQPRPPAVSPLAVKRAFSISDYMPTRQQLADAAGSRYVMLPAAGALGALAYNQYRLARKKRKGQPDDVGEFIPQALETVSGIDVPEGKPKEWWQAGLLGGGAGLALALKPNIEKVLYKGASTLRIVKKAEPYSEMPAAMRAGALAYGSWRKQQEQKSAQVFMPGNGPVTSQAPTKSTVKASPSVPQPMSSTQRGAVSPASTFALGQRLGSAK